MYQYSTITTTHAILISSTLYVYYLCWLTTTILLPFPSTQVESTFLTHTIIKCTITCISTRIRDTTTIVIVLLYSLPLPFTHIHWPFHHTSINQFKYSCPFSTNNSRSLSCSLKSNHFYTIFQLNIFSPSSFFLLHYVLEGPVCNTFMIIVIVS